MSFYGGALAVEVCWAGQVAAPEEPCPYTYNVYTYRRHISFHRGSRSLLHLLAFSQGYGQFRVSLVPHYEYTYPTMQGFNMG